LIDFPISLGFSLSPLPPYFLSPQRVNGALSGLIIQTGICNIVQIRHRHV
jgi:hypothetical protein